MSHITEIPQFSNNNNNSNKINFKIHPTTKEQLKDLEALVIMFNKLMRNKIRMWFKEIHKIIIIEFQT